MIVDKVKTPQVFVPVRITLESKEEADKMWHILNYHSEFEGYLSLTEGVTKQGLGCFQTDLWEAFSRKHNPVDC